MEIGNPDFDILVIGRACLDYLVVAERYPSENTKLAFAQQLREGGGQGSTVSCCIARLGGKPRYVGRVGDDDEGRFCINRLAAFGVDTSFISTVPGGRTTTAYVVVSKQTGARTILYEPYSLPPIELTDSLIKDISRSSVIVLDPQVTYLAKELRAHKGKARIVYDCERWRDGLPEMMMLADYFIPSSEFLDAPELSLKGATLPERILSLKKLVGGTLVITAGEDGAWYPVGKKLHHVHAPAVEVKDTTGAGDNFHAAFALGIHRGFNIHYAVRLGIAVASLSCRAYGSREGLPDFGEAWELAQRLKMEIIEVQ